MVRVRVWIIIITGFEFMNRLLVRIKGSVGIKFIIRSRVKI